MTCTTATRAAALLVATLLCCAAAVQAAPKDATIQLVDETVTAYITFDNNKTLKVTSKPTKIAPGTHWVKSVRITKKDKKGRTWELKSREQLGGIKNITVARKQEKIIDPGPPLSLHMWARQGDAPNDRQVVISFAAVGQYDALYYPGAFRGRKRPATPVFRIVTESGKTIHQGRFNVVDSTGRCTYTWKLPRGFKSKYKVDIKCAFGPFIYRSNREGHFFEIK